jgi:hypothetical protein
MPGGGLERNINYINIIADFRSQELGGKLGKRMDKIVARNS